MVILIGGTPSMPVDRHALRYHITWCFIAAPVVPDSTLGTHQVAAALQQALATLGLVPVSPVAAITGDPFIQFTVQVGYTGPGGDMLTLADVIEAADKLPLLADGLTPLRYALDVCEVEVRASGLSSDIVRAQNQVARQRALDRAKAADVANKAGSLTGAVTGAISDVGGNILGGIKDVGMFALGMAAIVGIVYVIVKYRP